MSALREVLAEITAARGVTSLDAIARRLNLGRDEVDAMVGYWIRKGRLSADDLAAACPTGGCGTCALGRDGAPGCGPVRGGPTLLAITPRRPNAPGPAERGNGRR
ncbi:FeoC-like transcriptional regulator [Thermopolyspora sp. NPDC052614]|uniref:FeoC-like transcriptional regulator n=1 Tax=Thermopolyspora sp. NPDC052614 TaxID=3155682 RepID=UPI00344ABCB3